MKKNTYFETSLLTRHDNSIIDNAVIQELGPGYHFDTHIHKTIEVIICLSGECTITAYNDPIVLSEGEYIAIFSSTPHSTDVSGENSCSILQLHFHCDVFNDIFSDVLQDNSLYFLVELSLRNKAFIKNKSFKQLTDCIFYIRQEIQDRQINWSKMSDLYLSQLIILLSRDMNSNIVNNPICVNRHLMNSIKFINEQYMNKIAIEDIALQCGITSRYLNKMFTENLNMCISSYITYVRINKSIEIMYERKSKCSFEQLAFDVGFSSLSHYSKVFKEKIGIPPKKYFEMK